MLKTFPTVGIIILRGEEVLLIAKDNHPKHAHQLPGGQIEKGESSVEAACRELEETTGLKAKVEDLIAIPTEWEAIIEKDYGKAIFTFTCFVCVKHTGEIKKTSTAAPEWVELEQLGGMILNPNTQNAIDAAIELMSARPLSK